MAREILDSRGNPTIETMVVLESGYRGTASVPSGASVGKYEAHELRDHDEHRYRGMGVLKAVGNVNSVIGPKIKGLDALNQPQIDSLMISLDGTPTKQNLGANSILSVSLAVAAAAASVSKQPLYRYLNSMFKALVSTPLTKIPTPTMNIINGGRHGAGNLDFQEFHIVPATNKRYREALQMGVEIYDSLREILTYRNAIHSVGDEGGFAPNLFTNSEALEILLEAIRVTPYHFGVDVFLGLDLAANNFFGTRGYQIKDKPLPMPTSEFIDYLKSLHDKYRLLILEDPLNEDDWDGWTQITSLLGHEVLIVGDDLLVSNPQRLQKAIDTKACSAILVKPNQVGTLTEFFEVVALAKKNKIATIVSHRSGETQDSFIADLGVAVQSEYVKFGAPARGERVVKYNRLSQIESELFP